MQQQAQTTFTSRLADFVVSTRFECLPPEVVVMGKNGFRDNLGVALAGSREPAVNNVGGDPGKCLRGGHGPGDGHPATPSERCHGQRAGSPRTGLR